MQLMSAIRRRGILLLVVIGVSMLAFLAGDALMTGGSFLQQQDSSVGEIGGEKIDYPEYNAELEKTIENYKERSQQTSLDEQVIGFISDQTWDNFVKARILGQAYKEIGLSVTGAELLDLVRGEDPHPSIVQAFTNPNTGQFDRSSVDNYLRNMDRDETGQARKQWNQFEKELKKDRQEEKYFKMVEKAVFIPQFLVEEDHRSKFVNATMDYVLMRYTDIEDSLVQVSSADIKRAYDENKYKHSQQPGRAIKYVSFPIQPSSTDTADILQWMEEKTEALMSDAGDSSFINRNAETRFVSEYKTQGSLVPVLDSVLFKQKPGFVMGPVLYEGTYYSARILDSKMVPDSVKARHILVGIENRSKEEAEVRADSIYQVLQKGGDFESLARQLSEDPGSGEQGGDLGWFTQGKMVKPFNDACFYGNKGDLIKVNSNFGVHVIRIDDQTTKKLGLKVAVLDRTLHPGRVTSDSIYMKASRFLLDAESDFEKAAENAGMVARVADNLQSNQKDLPGLQKARELVRWAWNAREGQISSILEMDDHYVIARLTQINDGKYRSLESMEAEMKALAIRDKKAKLFTDSLKSALKSRSALDEVAQAVNREVNPATNLSMNYLIISGAGREPYVTGYTFGLKPEVLSQPIKGEKGVYVLKMKEFSEAPEMEMSDIQRDRMRQNQASRARYDAFEALKKHAGVEDRRYKFY